MVFLSHFRRQRLLYIVFIFNYIASQNRVIESFSKQNSSYSHALYWLKKGQLKTLTFCPLFCTFLQLEFLWYQTFCKNSNHLFILLFRYVTTSFGYDYFIFSISNGAIFLWSRSHQNFAHFYSIFTNLKIEMFTACFHEHLQICDKSDYIF